MTLPTGIVDVHRLWQSQASGTSKTWVEVLELVHKGDLALNKPSFVSSRGSANRTGTSYRDAEDRMVRLYIPEDNQLDY